MLDVENSDASGHAGICIVMQRRDEGMVGTRAAEERLNYFGQIVLPPFSCI